MVDSTLIFLCQFVDAADNTEQNVKPFVKTGLNLTEKF